MIKFINFAKMNNPFTGIDKTWTLFLDRDGVINKKIDDDYVRRWQEFEFLPGAVEAIKKLSAVFGRVCILTNQRGIAKHLYSVSDLENIHEKMLATLTSAGGRIDGVYFCPHLGTEPECDCRKPKTGLAVQAKTRYPDIDFSRSVIAGDSSSDILLGKNLGMQTILISGETEGPEADKRFGSLSEYAATLRL